MVSGRECVYVLAAAVLTCASLSAAAAEQANGDVPALSDTDRAAAFPDVGGVDPAAMMPEDPLNTYLRFDQLEGRRAEGSDPLVWNVRGWVGHNLDKLWVRSEGSRVAGATRDAELEVLWGHAVARWWDVVVGAREELEPSREHWVAFGVQGLAPYRFELEGTAYLGEGGKAAARLEAEYELRITNRWFLQPRLELDWHSYDAPERAIAAGLASADAGLRLRYEIRRELAPYLGIVRSKTFGGSAELARARGEKTSDTELVAGVRFWF